MRYAIISDVHGNLEALQAVLDDLAKWRIEKLICLGDLVGYYANPNECVEVLRKKKAQCLRGNHDRAASGLADLSAFNVGARRALEWTKSVLKAEYCSWLRALPDEMVIDGGFLVCHGAPGDPDAYILTEKEAARVLATVCMMYSGVRVCFYGHTHIPALFATGEAVVEKNAAGELVLGPEGLYLINPGSVGQPRDGTVGASYIVYDSRERTVEWRQVEYDIRATQKKVYEAGLPSWLAERLQVGR